MVTINEMSVTGWKFKFVDNKIYFLHEMIQQSLDLLKKWQEVFPKEETWIQRNIGIPSLLVRIDCVGGEIGNIYEVEDRPSGVGITATLNKVFSNKLNRLSQNWPDYSIVVSPRRSSYDDHLYGKSILSLEEAYCSESLLLVRSEPYEKEFHVFEERSISTLKQEGNKSYGVQLGLWKEVDPLTDLPWETGFALKPKQGSKCNGIEIWTPGKINGRSTRTRIERTLKEYGSMYCQPLIYPLNSGIEGYSQMIYRVYFGYDTIISQWECLGGIWMARSNLKIHGATDSIVGPVIACG